MSTSQALTVPPPPLQRLVSYVTRAPRRVEDRRFWIIQALVIGTTALHVAVESTGITSQLGPHFAGAVHHIPPTIFVLPIVYASIHFGWEGASLTSLEVVLLATPNVVLWHKSGYEWVGELMQLFVIGSVGIVLAWRVERESYQRRRAEEATQRLRLQEEKYRRLFESAGDAILVFDETGQVREANAAASVLTGYPRARLGAVSISDLFWEQGLDPLNGCGAGDAPVPLTLRRADGAELLVDASCATLRLDGDKMLAQAVLRDVTDQRRRHETLQSFAHLATAAQEEERRRIARELHDETLQSLAFLSRRLDALQETQRLARAARREIGELHDLADQTMAALRRTCRNLRPSILDDLGLVPATRALADELRERSAIEADVGVWGELRRLAPDTELLAYRVVQEALNNVERHSRATWVVVGFEFGPGGLKIAVEDNGQGFPAQDFARQAARSGKLGLLGMQERAELMGGELTIESRARRGTRISLLLPAAVLEPAPATAPI